MAGGNLPALAQTSQLEVLIMSRSMDFAAFEKYLSFRNMKKQLQVRFVPIDDLIPGNIYGVTLTLAYARPILALGNQMLDYHFVFMNGDFILADGSLKTLGRVLQSGTNVVMAPSLRVTAEDLKIESFKKTKKTEAVLEIKPREFVKMSLPHLHPTTLGKVINFGDYHTIHPNQLFWKVNKDTLLGRYFLIFMLAIRPQKVIRKINSWCDYGFVPAFCPERPIKVLGDSDDFLMVETQEKLKEKDLLRIGPLQANKIKESLNEWLTFGHLKNFQSEVIFHSQNIPLNISKAQKQFNDFISKVEVQKVALKKYANHFYWKSGVAYWLDERIKHGIFNVPPELETGNMIKTWLNGLKYKVSYKLSRSQVYSWSEEEPIMEPRLVLLEQELEKILKSSSTKNIVVDKETLISTICVLRRIARKKNYKINLLQLTPNEEKNKTLISKIKNRGVTLFILSNISSVEICRSAINNKLNSYILILPKKKGALKEITKNLVDLYLQKIKIDIKSFGDSRYWFLKKTAQVLKLVSIDVKEVTRKLLLNNLYGHCHDFSEKKITNWKVKIPKELQRDIHSASWQKESKKRKIFWKKRSLRLGKTLVHCTFPVLKEPISLPRIRIPFIYRLHSMLNRLIYENILVEKISSQDILIRQEIPDRTSLCIISLQPIKPSL